ncbi:MAG: CDP-alcohol phosphatidyltransferase family protein [Chloroflexota bacterium]
MHTSPSAVLSGLRLRWAQFAVLSLLSLFGAYWLLKAAWSPGNAARWLALAGLTLAYLLAVLWRGLPANHRAGETQLLPSFGWGNRMTLLRGLLVAGLVGFLFSPRPAGWLAWIPGILYTLADAADFLDGYLARRTNHATRLGEILDMSFDGLGVLVASSLAVQYNQVPAWYLSVALARYIFITGLWLRKRLAKPIYELPHSTSRRLFAGLQMGFIAVVLWPVFSPPGTTIAAALFALPFLAGFLRDWLAISGVLRPSQPSTSSNAPARRHLHWLPILLRVGVIITGGWVLLQRVQNTTVWGSTPLALSIIDALVILSLSFGILARSSAVLGLLLVGLHQVYTGLNPGEMLLVVFFTAILFLGSGPYSLWAPEEYLVHHRAGERQLHNLKGQT